MRTAPPVSVSHRSNLIPPDLQALESSQRPGAISDDITAEQVPSSVPALFAEAAEMRSEYAKAEAQREKVTADGLTIAFKLVLEARDKSAKAAMEKGARNLGARPNRRGGIEHLAVYIVWPPGTISPSLRTRFTQAVRAGLERGCSPEDFRRIAADGAGGRGGVRQLAKIGRGFAHRSKAPDASPPAGMNPSSEARRSAHATNVDRPILLRERGFVRAIIVPEPVVEALLASDLETGDEFSLVVRVTTKGGLEAVAYLGARRTSRKSRASN